MWDLGWLCKIQIWYKSKIVLYRYIKFDCIYKKDVIYKDIAEDVETRFDTSNYELEFNSIDRTLPNELGGKIMA